MTHHNRDDIDPAVYAEYFDRHPNARLVVPAVTDRMLSADRLHALTDDTVDAEQATRTAARIADSDEFRTLVLVQLNLDATSLLASRYGLADDVVEVGPAPCSLHPDDEFDLNGWQPPHRDYAARSRRLAVLSFPWAAVLDDHDRHRLRGRGDWN